MMVGATASLAVKVICDKLRGSLVSSGVKAFTNLCNNSFGLKFMRNYTTYVVIVMVDNKKESQTCVKVPLVMHSL